MCAVNTLTAQFIDILRFHALKQEIRFPLNAALNIIANNWTEKAGIQTMKNKQTFFSMIDSVSIVKIRAIYYTYEIFMTIICSSTSVCF